MLFGDFSFVSSARPTPTVTFFQSSLFLKDKHRHRTVEFHLEDKALRLLRGDEALYFHRGGELRTAVPDSPREIGDLLVICCSEIFLL